MGFEVILSSQSNDILSAEKLILPGVGNFKKAMNNLDKLNLKPVLNEAVINNAKPILGICLGMQLFSSFSEEGNVEGLDWIKGKVVKFKFSNDIDLAIPHVGWNHVKQTQKSKFGIDIDINKKYYFNIQWSGLLESVTEHYTERDGRPVVHLCHGYTEVTIRSKIWKVRLRRPKHRKST